MYVVYKTTNTVNGKIYVGQHKNINNMRHRQNGIRYVGSGKILGHAIKKYGRSVFDVEILEECDTKEEVNEREAYWISKLEPEYNIAVGGTGGDLFTDNPNKEQIRKNYSKAHKGRKKSEEHKKKIREGLKKHWSTVDKSKYNNWGHVHTDDTKRKIGIKSKKMWNSPGFKDEYKRKRKLNPQNPTVEQTERKIKNTTRWYIITNPHGNEFEFYGRKTAAEFLKGKVWAEPLFKTGKYKGWICTKEKR